MTLLNVAAPAGVPVRGVQQPRICRYPPYVSSAGPDVVELCAAVGVFLDPWQQLILGHGLGETDQGRWSAFEVCEVLPRQNGKGDVLMARELAGLLLLDEVLLIHTAHEFKTCLEAFTRICTVIVNSDDLRRKFKTPHTTTGRESIETLDGRQLRFLARSKTSGRGFTGDCVLFDEAQILTPAPIRATLPTLSAVPNPQVWYAATAGDQQSIHLGAVRVRALAGDDPQLAYMEWSVDPESYDADSPADWARANPAMGIRISAEYISRERRTMAADPAGFAIERLGVGDWPLDGSAWIIPQQVWERCDDGQTDPSGERTRPVPPVCFALDVNPIRTVGAIAVAGGRPDGVLAVEVADMGPGTDWLVARARQLDEKWQPLGWVIDRAGPAASLIPELVEAGLTVVEPDGRQTCQAAETFYDLAVHQQLRHTSDSRLASAVAGAVQLPVGDAWRWGRRRSVSEISPLMAASLAVWGFRTAGGELGPDDIYIG
jgi:hypothetical protein